VAAASIISKYLRELAMDQFNSYWQQHLVEIKPTRGYPQVAKRFRGEMESWLEKLGISEVAFWRCR